MCLTATRPEEKLLQSGLLHQGRDALLFYRLDESMTLGCWSGMLTEPCAR
jgi:hypothetical protein